MTIDNGPNIGQLDLEKERRWQVERESSFAEFKRVAQYLLKLPEGRRTMELDRYEKLNGRIPAQTLRGYVKGKMDAAQVKPFT